MIGHWLILGGLILALIGLIGLLVIKAIRCAREIRPS